MSTNLTQQRLEQAFHASGLTQAELARASGIDRGSISLYLSGRYRPKADKLLRLAAALDVSPQWLTGVEDNPGESAIPLNVITGVDANGTLIPSGETLLVPRTALLGEDAENYFVWKVTGLAMYPRLLPDDHLLVRRSRRLVQGSVAVLAQGGCLLARQVQGELLLPANPEFPPRTLEDMTVLGRAIQLIRTL